MDDLKLIKRHYGENMMHLCRELFPTLLETPGRLFETLSSTFAYSRLLYDDIKNKVIDENVFKDLIFNNSNKVKKKEIETSKTPFELLREKGYTLYECKTERDIQSFRHFYKRNDNVKLPKYIDGRPSRYNGEELCTFNGGRLDNSYVFFVVQDGAENIEREKYNGIEEREDDYGRSVLSIQFSKGDKTNDSTIITRYNHAVKNPNATFQNDLDKLAPGLKNAFQKTYGFVINSNTVDIDIPGYVLANDGKLYKYNYEINNIYYCPDNIIIYNHEVQNWDKSRYLIVDYFIIDLEKKRIELFDDFDDAFIDNLEFIKSIKIKNNKETNDKTLIINDDIILIINSKNQIKYYKNDHITDVFDDFLSRALGVEEIDLENVESISPGFLRYNEILERINLPKCKIFDENCLEYNKNLKKISLPECERIHSRFLCFNTILKELYLPKCKSIGSESFKKVDIEELYLPKCEVIGNYVMRENKSLSKIYLPVCLKAGDFFLQNNKKLKKVVFPLMNKLGFDFLTENNNIEYIYCPKLEKIDAGFLQYNTSCKRLYAPHLTVVGAFCADNNEIISNYIKNVVECNNTPNIYAGKENQQKESYKVLKRKIQYIIDLNK